MKTNHPPPDSSIPRRDALRRLALLTGAALSLPVQAALRGETLNGNPLHFSAGEQTLIAELAEVVMPATNTPGAKAAGVGGFIEHVIGHCSDLKQQETFRKGLQQTDALSQALFGKNFLQLGNPQRINVMAQLAKGEKPFFMSLRELTIVGYFTSETGATQALDYVAVPGRFQGDIPLKPGQRAWAT